MTSDVSTIPRSDLKNHIVVITTAGKGHLLPMISLSDSMKCVDTSVCMSIILPTQEACELPKCPDQVRLVTFDLPPEAQQHGMGALLWLAEHESELKDEVNQILDRMATEHERGGYPPPRFILYDMFATYAQEVAVDRGLPHGLCVTSPLPFLFAWAGRSCLTPAHLADKHAGPLHLPGLGELPRAALPDDRLLPEVFEKSINRFKTTNLVLMNDCEVLYLNPDRLDERSPLVDATEHTITGDGRRTPVYLTGMWASKDARLSAYLETNSSSSAAEIDPIIAWLDSQVANSVVFIALGSWCPMPEADVCELARGLEASGRPFLWAYRPNSDVKIQPPHSPPDWAPLAPREPLGADGLPLGFEEAVASRSMVTRWVDQPRILAHPAISCFVTHCGWNSLTEALTICGKPLLALPLGAEQHMNAYVMTEFLKLGKRLWEPTFPRSLDRDKVAKTINDVLDDTLLIDHVAKLSRQLRCTWTNSDSLSAQHTRRFLAENVYEH